MVLLGGAFTLASVIIFFLGVFTGKGIEERRIVKMEEPAVKIPVKPAAPGGPAGQGGTTKEEMTFYNTLTKPREPSQTLNRKNEAGGKDRCRVRSKPQTKKHRPRLSRSKKTEKHCLGNAEAGFACRR
jgi:hypothetical protein